MDNTKKKLEDIAEVLYKGDTTLGMSMMVDVIGDLGMIAGMIEDEDIRNRYVNDGLKQALEAMEVQDGTLLADVITYELIEIINGLN